MKGINDMNTSDNIISEIAPERIFRGLYDKAINKRKKQSLEKVNNACKNQYILKSMDFSIPTIAKLIAGEGGPSEQALRNKNGEEYRLLIGAWAEYSNGSTKKMPQKALNIEEENYEEIANSISSSTARSLFYIFVGKYKRLQSELIALKRLGETTLIVDDRPKSKNTESQNDVLVSSTLNLTEDELDALKSAISEDFFKEQGWTISKERIRKSSGITLYGPDYLNAINKILENCNNNIPE